MKTTRRSFFGLASIPFLTPLFRSEDKPSIPAVEFDEDGKITNIEELWNQATPIDNFEMWYEFGGKYFYETKSKDKEQLKNLIYPLCKDNPTIRGITVFSSRYTARIITDIDIGTNKTITGIINLRLTLNKSKYIYATIIPHKDSTFLLPLNDQVCPISNENEEKISDNYKTDTIYYEDIASMISAMGNVTFPHWKWDNQFARWAANKYGNLIRKI